MRLLHGNQDEPYVFGGRGDELEERLFRKAGLGPWNSFRTVKSWRVVFEAGEIPDFYLDEREVSAGEYLEFLHSPGGWILPRWWTERSVPGPTRVAELEGWLAKLPAEQPATGVTWDEARAYANWMGKRLPSYVEWEYAVRGGVSYRPTATWHADAPSSASLAKGLERPLIVGGGNDVTPGTLVHDLCSNVSEWTSTPTSFAFDADEPLSQAQHADENRLFYLDPLQQPEYDRRPRYFVVGGSYESAGFDFAVVDRRARDWQGPSVGFRCLLPASELSQGTTLGSRTVRALTD
jgi:formylglycine-generating enzyme required for sulfatase activity